MQEVDLKVVLLGDGNVGLTALLKMYLYQEKYTEYNPTVLDKYKVKLQVKDFIVNLEIVDTAGQENFDEIRKSQYKDVDAVLIAYSVLSDITLEHVNSYWVKELKSHFGRKLPNIVIVGTKLDLYPNNPSNTIQLAPESLGRAMKTRINAFSHFRVSAHESVGVNQTFESLILAGLRKRNLIKKKQITSYSSHDFVFLENPKKTFTATAIQKVNQNEAPIALALSVTGNQISSDVPIAFAVEVSEDSIGVNNLTKSEVEYELTRFYSVNDSDMLTELKELVNWSMINGLEALNKMLVERFGTGLEMYSETEVSAPIPITAVVTPVAVNVSNMKVDIPAVAVAVPVLQDRNATGVNGLTKHEVRQELIRFYTEFDPDMLSELANLVEWCMVNGLEQFEKLLVERFGRGLPMFESDN